MKKYSIKALIFIIGFLLFTLFIKESLFFVIKQIKIGDYGVLNRIVNGEINSDILVIGSSRGYVGINPKVISKATGLSSYNISQDGKRFGVQLPLLKTYLKYNKKPEIIIQEIGCYSVGLEKGINDIHKYLPYLSEDEFYNGLYEVESTLWLQKYFPFANFYYLHADFQRRILKDVYLSYKKGNDYLINGFFPRNSKWSINEAKFLNELKDGYVSPIDEKALVRLQELIRICENMNIKLILVYLPDYFKFPPHQVNRDEIVKIFTDLSERNNIHFIDYKDLEIAKDRDNFYNFRHLNDKGAYKFSEILGNDINEILISRDSFVDIFNQR